MFRMWLPWMLSDIGCVIWLTFGLCQSDSFHYSCVFYVQEYCPPLANYYHCPLSVQPFSVVIRTFLTELRPSTCGAEFSVNVSKKSFRWISLKLTCRLKHSTVLSLINRIISETSLWRYQTQRQHQIYSNSNYFTYFQF